MAKDCYFDKIGIIVSLGIPDKQSEYPMDNCFEYSFTFLTLLERTQSV